MADLRPPVPEDEDLPEPPKLRALRRLVTALTATLILGVVAVAATLVIRLAGAAPTPAFDPWAVTAETVTLPHGETVMAVGAAGDALILATRDAAGAERLRLFSAEDGAPARVVAIERRAPAGAPE